MARQPEPAQKREDGSAGAQPSPGWPPQLKPTGRGTLRPCGENGTGTVLEFFANPADIPDLLANGITTTRDGGKVTFTCRLTSTPYYRNGDVQIQAILQ